MVLHQYGKNSSTTRAENCIVILHRTDTYPDFIQFSTVINGNYVDHVYVTQSGATDHVYDLVIRSIIIREVIITTLYIC